MAVVGVIEPQPALDHDAADRDRRALGRAPRRPLRDGALRVSIDDAGIVGLGAGHQNLHLGVAGRKPTREVRSNPDDAADLALDHKLLRLRHRRDHHRIEIRRELKAGRDLSGIGRGILHHDRHRHVGHIEREAVTEQQDQNDRHHDPDRDAARIAQQLPALLVHQRGHPPPFCQEPAGSITAGHGRCPTPECLASRRACCTTAMNASSMFGSRPEPVEARVRISAGVPWASSREDIRSLVGEVVITPGHKRGESHPILRGELMAILDLAAGRRRSPNPEVITNALAGPRNHFHYNSLTVPV